MIKVYWDQGFKKTYRKRVKNEPLLKKKFWTVLEIFSKDPFEPRLRTHKLSGKLEGLWALTVTFDCRLIFRFVEEDEVLLIDICGHNEVY